MNKEQRHQENEKAVDYLRNIDPKNENQKDSMIFLAAASDDEESYKQSVTFKGTTYNLAQNILAALRNPNTPVVIKKAMLNAVSQFIGHAASDEKEYKLGAKLHRYTEAKYGAVECNCPNCKNKRANPGQEIKIGSMRDLMDFLGQGRKVNQQ